MKPSTRILALQKQLYNQYKSNKKSWIDKYGSDAEAVMTGASFKNAERMANKEDKKRIKEAIKQALSSPMKSGNEVDSKAFIQSRQSEDNPEDVVQMDVPLLIRMLEYAREDTKTDMDLHKVAENLIQLSSTGRILDMSDYNSIISPDESI